MIERQIVAQKINEKRIEKFVMDFLGGLSCSKIIIQRTPLGEKLLVYTSRPGLIVGKKGANVKLLTQKLKVDFKLENPQIEVVEIENPNLDAATVAKSLVAGLDRFGPKRFKAMAYKALDNVMKAGARGVEIVISGRGIPGARAKTWRFLAGYLKKSGDISENYTDKAKEACNLRSGTIGVKVKILHPEVRLPDDVYMKEVTIEQKIEEMVKLETPEIVEEKTAEEPKKKTRKKKTEEATETVKEKKPRKTKKTKTEELKDGETEN